MTAEEFLLENYPHITAAENYTELDGIYVGVSLSEILEAYHKAASEEAIHKVDEVMQKHADSRIMQMASAIAFRSSLLHFLGLGKIPQKKQKQ